MRHSSLIHAEQMRKEQQDATEIDGKWVAARPEGFASFRHRVWLAWLVFTGKADALIWYKQ